MKFINNLFMLILILLLLSCSTILNKQPLEKENSADVATPSEISAALEPALANPVEIANILSSTQ